MALILAVSAVFAACGDDKKKDDDDKKEETTVAATEKTTEAVKDKVDVEDEDEDEDDSLKPGTKGFTLEELEEALMMYASTKDWEYLQACALSESNAILEYMLAKDSSDGNAEFAEEYYCGSITEMYSETPIIPLNVLFSDVIVNFANDGKWHFGDQGDEVNYENALDYYVETYAPDYYDVAAAAVANAYKGSGESVKFVDLSFVDVSLMYDDGTGIGFSLFIIETNTGWFFLYELI